MDRAATVTKKITARVARHSQPHLIPRAVHIAPFEIRFTHPEELGSPWKICLCQVNEAVLFTTDGAAGLALEADSCGHVSLWGIRQGFHEQTHHKLRDSATEAGPMPPSRQCSAMREMPGPRLPPPRACPSHRL